ncbi:phage tail protein [Bradyrhizobium sp. BR 1433]|uniref:phage tail protein n=1 Tax=Bradyrhizobium sp. BR 1433 TaxID=3447967 RepID=UPI003EE8017B
MAYGGSLIGGKEVGEIFDYAGATPPPGCATCDGQAILRANYPVLFSRVGTTWGAGDGTTTFNLPSLMGRFRRHRDNGSISGSVGTLQAADTAPHTHLVAGTTSNENANHSHSFSGTTGSMNQNASHSHGFTVPARIYGNFQSITSGGAIIGIQVQNGDDGLFRTSSTNTDRQHAFSGTTATESANHAHFVSFASGSYGGSETRPMSATVLTCIRVF